MLQVVKLLLEYKAEVTPFNGASPLALAASGGFFDVVQLLLEHNADANAVLFQEGKPIKVIYYGIRTPLYSACEKKNYRLAKLLLDYNADPNLNMAEGDKTPLHLVTSPYDDGINFQLLKLLVHCGANVNAYTDIGTTALHQLCFPANNDISCEVAEFLIQNGADVNIHHCSKKYTALHFALITRNKNLVWLLVTSGADLNIPCSSPTKPQTVWDLAGNDTNLLWALRQRWIPQEHHKFPKHIRDAIVSVLLVAKQQKWKLDNSMLQLILSYIAFDFYSTKRVINVVVG